MYTRKGKPAPKVFASTFDAFFQEVEIEKAAIPRIEKDLEIGDTWIYGTASDPLKGAQHR